MKKLFSLLFVALLAMSAWADTVVTVDFNAQGWSTNTLVSDLTIDGVKLTFDKGTNPNSTKPTYFTNTSGGALRLYGGNTMTITAPQNLLKIDFTFLSGEGTNDILSNPGNYNKAGKQWTIGSSDPSSEVVFTIDGDTGHRRIQKLVITMEDAEPVTELVDPVFTPNGGEFTGSLAVTVSCATDNASIYVYKVIDGEVDYSTGMYFFESGEFYVTETMTYAAYAEKGDDYTDFVYATFTKVEQTVEAPVFTPAACIFTDRLDVTLTCATPNAKIYYSLDEELWSEYVDAIPVTDDITIWAKAKVGDVESEVVSATYTKVPTTTEITFDPDVDLGNGADHARHSFTVVKYPVTMFVGDGMISDNGQYRFYGKNDSSGVVFTSVDYPIIKIEFTGQSGYAPSKMSLAEGTTGTWTTSGLEGVWEGNAYEVAFDLDMQARIVEIIVTVAGEVEPTYLLGDVNHDGFVNVADVTELIDMLQNTITEVPVEADLNFDNAISIGDVTALIDMLLITGE